MQLAGQIDADERPDRVIRLSGIRAEDMAAHLVHQHWKGLICVVGTPVGYPYNLIRIDPEPADRAGALT